MDIWIVMENGLEYLQDIEEFSNVENFPYYYTMLKKLNLLRDLKKQNFPVSEFYQEDLTAADAMEINQRFEDLTVSDIITAVKKRLLVLESDYAGTEEVQEWDISGDIDDIVPAVELRARLSSALYMLAEKADTTPDRKHGVPTL